MRLALHEKERGERFEAALTSHLCPRAALGFIGEIEILELRGIPAVGDARGELRRELLLLGDGLGDGLLALLYILEAVVLLGNGRYLDLVEGAGALLAVAGDEGDGGSVVEERQRALHLSLAQAEALGDQSCENRGFHR